jgi:hypothetical protein
LLDSFYVLADQAHGKKWYEVLTASDAIIDLGVETTQRMAAGGNPASLELEFFDHNQNKVVVEIHVHPVFNEDNF